MTISITDDVQVADAIFPRTGNVIGWTDLAVAAYNAIDALGLLPSFGGNAPGTPLGPPIIDPAAIKLHPRIDASLYVLGIMLQDQASSMVTDFAYSQVTLFDPLGDPYNQTTDLNWQWNGFMWTVTFNGSVIEPGIQGNIPFGPATSLPFGLSKIVVQTVNGTDDGMGGPVPVPVQTGERGYLNPTSMGYGCLGGMALIGEVSNNDPVHEFNPQVKVINFLALYKLP